ncbi:hypothetical protein FQA39_LY14402 [Lamprigera yunnana]|nr:hypothetical protein FQA39_LY14402 [Lamprigera yunnana]
MIRQYLSNASIFSSLLVISTVFIFKFIMQDTSGLVDNVAESGEESEDEWNYIKGDQAEKENLDLAQNDKEICDLTFHLDADMSQLNPNAAEFVPVSPKRNTKSPAYQGLMDDLVIAQSPKRIANNDYDINVPHPQEFESEIKSRPSDVQENTDEDESDNMSTPASQALMENLLNGKSIEEIEFQPNSTPIRTQKTSEFHFGPNATPFSTPSKLMDQSETLSTKAVVDDESNYLEDPELDEMSDYQVSAKEEDPMSMSFYQDKEDANINPFDLNKVQLLPENIDDFLEKPQEDESLLHDTISDLPEHDPLATVSLSKSPDLQLESIVVAQSPVLESENIPIRSIEALTPDLPSEQIEIPNASSPFEDNDTQSQSSGVHSPDFKVQSPCFDIDVHAEEAKSQISETDLDIRSPIMGSPSPVPEIQTTLPESCSPAFDTHTSESMVPSTFDVDEAIGACSPMPIMHSPNLENEVIEIPLQSPISQSPILEICQSHSPLRIIQSPTDEKEFTEANSSLTGADPLDANKVSSPIPTAESPLNISEGAIENDLADPISQSSLEVHEVIIENSSPISNSPLPFNVNEGEIEISSPILTTQSPLDVLEVAMEGSSPVPTTQSLLDDVLNNTVKISFTVPTSESPIDVHEIATATYSPVPDIEPFGAVPEKTEFSSSLFEDTLNAQCLSSELHSDTSHESEAAICEAPKDLLSPVKSPSPEPLIQHQPKCPTPTQELDSPIEDITSSVNDSPVSTASLTTEKPMTTVTANDKTTIPVVEVLIEGIDVQSFLERSFVPDLQSPLSSVTSPQSVDENRYIEKPSSVELRNYESETVNKYVLEDFDIRSEIIAPEYPVHTVTTPSEESRTEDLIECKKSNEVETVDLTVATPNTTATESDAKLAVTTDSTLTATTDVTLASAAVAVTAATAVAAVATVAEKKPATKTKSVASTITKRPATKPSVTAANKTLNSISKNPSKSIPLKSSTSAAMKMTSAKTPPISKTMNGDVKPSVTKKLHAASTTPKLASTKLLPTKTSKPIENKANTRPTASLAMTTTRGAIKPSTTKTTAAAAKPTAATTSKSPAPLKTAPPKPKSTMPPTKPRPISKAPDAEKQLKETVNKQITARTPPTNRTIGSPGKPLTSTTRKIDIKPSGVGSTLTKASAKSTDVRKPAELIRPITKPKTTGVVKKTITKNGTNEVTTKVSTITTTTTVETQLIKDISPIIENNIIDNSQILEVTTSSD